jgi:hypothetical protein
MLLDCSGHDVYTGTDPKASQAAGHDGDKREYGSIALMLDLGGANKYSQGQTNNEIWLKPLYGCGIDMDCATHRPDCFQRFRRLCRSSARQRQHQLTENGRDARSTIRLYPVAPVDTHQSH